MAVSTGLPDAIPVGQPVPAPDREGGDGCPSPSLARQQMPLWLDISLLRALRACWKKEKQHGPCDPLPSAGATVWEARVEGRCLESGVWCQRIHGLWAKGGLSLSSACAQDSAPVSLSRTEETDLRLLIQTSRCNPQAQGL